MIPCVFLLADISCVKIREDSTVDLESWSMVFRDLQTETVICWNANTKKDNDGIYVYNTYFMYFLYIGYIQLYLWNKCINYVYKLCIYCI